MFNSIPSSYALIASVFLLNLPSVRLIDCHINLQLLCNDMGVDSVKNYLYDPFGPSNENLEVTCEVRHDNPLVGWSLSPDGTEEIMINTSLAKYTVSENTLRINGVDISDEGLYRCVYARQTTIKRLCIFMHARAVFASCPSTRSYDGCSESENISVTAGEDIHFNASIVHIPEGNCGFKQSIDNMELRNCSNIDCTSWSTVTWNDIDRISATMSPDIERRFILSHSMMEDSGVYQVVVRGRNPQDGGQSQTSITKTYRVTVQEPTTTTIATTEEKETTVANGTSFSTATTDASQSTNPTTTVYDTNETALQCSSAKPILCAMLAVTVTILAMATITLVLILCKLKICKLRKLKGYTLQLSRDDNGENENERVGQEASTSIQIDSEDITDIAVMASSSSPNLNENDSAHHSDNSAHTAPHLRENQQVLQQNFDSSASSSSGTSTPAPEHQSNDDQDILRVLQDSNASSSSGTSTPAPEYQSNNDQVTKSWRTENSPEDVSELCSPSEIQRVKREGLRLDLSSRPTLPDLMNHVAAKTPTKWMVLGIQLGLEAAQLQALDHQHRGKSDSIFADMFDHWGKSSGLKPVAWSTMIEALKSESVGEIALAHHLESTVLSTCRDSNNNMDDGWPQQSQE